MIIFTVIAVVFAVLAGVGIKYLVDRLWPWRGIAQTEHALSLMIQLLEESQRARHAYSADDTLNVLADGMFAGERSALQRERRLRPAHGPNWQPGVAYDQINAAQLPDPVA